MGEREKIRFTSKRKEVISSGAIILHVLIATMVAGLLLSAWWRENSLSYDIVILREQHYKNRYMTDLVLSYGIERLSLIKKLGLKEFTTIDCSFIAKLLGEDFGATLTFSGDSLKVVYATLYKNKGGYQKVCGVSCIVE